MESIKEQAFAEASKVNTIDAVKRIFVAHGLEAPSNHDAFVIIHPNVETLKWTWSYSEKRMIKKSEI